MRDSRKWATAGLIGIGIGFGLALALSPALRRKVKESAADQFGDFYRQAAKAWAEYPERIAYAIAAGREAAQAKEEELEKALSGSKKMESVEETPKYII